MELDNPAALPLTHCLLDLERGVVRPRDGSTPIRLTTRERELLRFLAERSPAPVSRDDLMSKVWGYADTALSRACDTTIRRLRTKIEADPANPDHLLTAHGYGYQLVCISAEGPRPARPSDLAPRAPLLVFGPLRVDLEGHEVLGPGGSVRLAVREVSLLRRLHQANGAVVERASLIRHVWGTTTLHDRRIDNTIYRLRAKIEVDPSAPRHLRSSRGGYQLMVDEPETVEILALPGEVDRRFGTELQVEQVMAHLERERLVTLTGPGGIGKSRLALAVAQNLRERGVKVAWVDACALRDEQQLQTAVSLALRARVSGTLGELLRSGGPLVLVLDDLGPIVDLAELLGCAPEFRIVATSRRLLRCRGERVVQVLPLDSAAAVALFRDRAVREPLAGELADVAALVVELEGLPLAIELAAARTVSLSLAALRERAARPLELLVSRDVGRNPRHRSLRGSLDASYELVGPAAQQMLAQLSVFEGSFSIEAVEAVVVLPPGSPPALDVLEELTDISLVRAQPDGRCSLLVPVREYAAERLGEGSTPAECRHGAFYAEGPFVEERVEVDRANFLSAMERAIARRDGGIAARVFARVCPLWNTAGPIGATVEAARRILELPLDIQAAFAVEWHAARAETMVSGGDLGRAAEHLARARAMAQEIGDPRKLFASVDQLAILAHHRGDAAAFSQLARESYALSLRCSDAASRLQGLLRLARALDDEGALDDAAGLLAEADHIEGVNPGTKGTIAYKRAQLELDRGRLSQADLFIGRLADTGFDRPSKQATLARRLRLAGRCAEALALAQQAAEEFERRGWRSDYLYAVMDTAWDHLHLGDVARAQHAYTLASTLCQGGDRSSAEWGLGWLALETGHLVQAESFASSALGCAKSRYEEMTARVLLGWVLCLQGHISEAIARLLAVRSVPLVEAEVALRLGEALAWQGDLDEALVRLRLAESLSGEVELWAAPARVGQAGVLARLGRTEEASALLRRETTPSLAPHRRVGMLLAAAELGQARGAVDEVRGALVEASGIWPAAQLGPRWAALST